MGTSMVQFRERGFWASDAVLQVWFDLLADALEVNEPRQFVKALIKMLRRQARSAGVGCLALPLHFLISFPEEVDIVANAGRAALADLKARGDWILKSELNERIGQHSGCRYEDLAVASLEAVGVAFIGVLEGTFPGRVDAAPIGA